MHKEIIGYTSGVFDLFHIGHLNLFKHSKGLCDRLIVVVITDPVVIKNKNKKPIIPYDERVEILESIKYVDLVVSQEPDECEDKFKAWEKYKFDIMFVGDDWYGTKKWKQIEAIFKQVNVEIVYFPYTKSTSSTKINNILDKFI
tara:strand:- start:15640 stop:16071 length:432 start_codon:yes stop_codon:yes gene_type:complete